MINHSYLAPKWVKYNKFFKISTKLLITIIKRVQVMWKSANNYIYHNPKWKVVYIKRIKGLIH